MHKNTTIASDREILVRMHQNCTICNDKFISVVNLRHQYGLGISHSDSRIN